MGNAPARMDTINPNGTAPNATVKATEVGTSGHVLASAQLNVLIASRLVEPTMSNSVTAIAQALSKISISNRNRAAVTKGTRPTARITPIGVLRQEPTMRRAVLARVLNIRKAITVYFASAQAARLSIPATENASAQRTNLGMMLPILVSAILLPRRQENVWTAVVL